MDNQTKQAILPALLLAALPFALSAQACGFTLKNVCPLPPGTGQRGVQAVVFSAPTEPLSREQDLPRPPAALSLLPKWSADKLPFFCKIEHQWARGSRVPLKFRLGSVDYVDWLEGKRY